MRTVAVLLGWSWPSRVIQIFNQISGLLAKQNFLGWSALGDTQWVWRSKADNYRGCTMYRLGGGGHLGDSLFLQRRATIMDKYAQLRLTHPALHSDLRDFQVNCGCQRLDIALPFWKIIILRRQVQADITAAAIDQEDRRHILSCLYLSLSLYLYLLKKCEIVAETGCIDQLHAIRLRKCQSRNRKYDIEKYSWWK